MTDAVGHSTPSRRRSAWTLNRSFFELSAARVTSLTYSASFFRQRALDRTVFHSAILRNWSRVRYPCRRAAGAMSFSMTESEGLERLGPSLDRGDRKAQLEFHPDFTLFRSSPSSSLTPRSSRTRPSDSPCRSEERRVGKE